MSYDFFLGRPKDRANAIGCICDGELIALGMPKDVSGKLESLLGPLTWSDEPIPDAEPMRWSGPYEGGDTWYEFILHGDPVIVIQVRTSHRTNTRGLIPRICRALDLYAFDTQTNTLAGQPDS